MAQIQLSGAAALASVTSSPVIFAPVQSDYSRILKCTIPATKVSATLVDFPVPIHLHDAAGTGALDITQFFEDIRPAASSVNDDFSTNDGEINYDKWYYSNTGGSPTYIREDNNQLKINFTTNYARLISHFGLEGDFDLQWDFDCTGSVHTASWYYGLILNSSGQNFSLWRTYNVGGDEYRSNISGSSLDDSTSDHTGKLRFVRSGSQITTYYWNGSGWTQLRTSSQHALDISYIIIDAQTWTSMPNPTVYIDNFTLNSGTPLWRQSHPGARKIAAFTEGGQPLPVEIDLCDDLQKHALLHVKVPYISATVDTNIYLAWKDATIDDSPIVDHSGTPAARQVWDDDFFYVAHMAKKLGSDKKNEVFQLDQSIIENTLTIDAHNMDEGDGLWNATHGAYFNFDTERYQFDEEDWMEPLASELTMEGYFFVDVVSNWAGIVSKDDASLGRQYSLVITNIGCPRMMIDGNNAAASVAVSTATWYYLAGRFDPGTFLKVRQDKSEVASVTVSVPSSIDTGAAPLQIGNFYDDAVSTYMMDGGIGEVRLSKVCRSEAWCDLTSDGLHDALLALTLTTSLSGTAAVLSVTSTPELEGWKELGGIAAITSLTSTPKLLTGEESPGALPVIVVIT